MSVKRVMLGIDELRAIFLKPASALPVPENTEPCDGGRIPIAEHRCSDEGPPDIWIELQADHDLAEVVAGGPDEWSAWWRAVDDTGSDALSFPISFCPFCGVKLDELYDIDGYYRRLGFTDQMLSAEPLRN
jgi:hypothetical protein